MTCLEAREHFSARADTALSAAELAAVDAHLAGCGECRREWQRFAATVGLLRAVEPARAPAGFVDRVLVAAARPQPWYRRLAHGLLVPWTIKLPLEAAAVVMLAGLAVLIFQHSPELQTAAHAPQTANEAAARDERTQLSELTPSREIDAVRSTAGPDTPAGAAPPAPSTPPAPGARFSPAPPAASAPALADSRAAATAESSDKLRLESPPPRIAQQQADEPPMGRRQQSARSAPPAAVVPPSVAATAPAENIGEARAKRPDRPAKEAERKAEEGDAQVRPLSARVPPNVELRLAVADLAGAQAAIVSLVERLGGALVTGPTPGTLEIMVPRDTVAAFGTELARLGTLRIVRQPSELPENVRIGLQLGP
jgi:hypothetical protein